MTDTPEIPSTPSGDGGASKPTGATALLELLRDAIDDLTVRATPTVREVSARAADLTATAAAKAAPYARKAGEATADASGKLAERSRNWAAELRASIATDDAASATATAEGPASTTAEAPAPAEAPSEAPADVTDGTDSPTQGGTGETAG